MRSLFQLIAGTPACMLSWLLVPLILLAMGFFWKRETRKLIVQIRRIRRNRSSAQIQAPGLIYDRELLDEINRLLDYLNAEDKKLYSRRQEIQEMVTGISHDFRTPLTSISGYVQILKERGPSLPDEEIVRYLDIIESRAASLAALADDFYTYSTLEAQDLKAKMENGNPLNALRSVLAQYYDELEMHFPEVRADIPEYSLSMPIDRVFLERIFSNLVRNALTYGSLFFCIKARLENNELRIVFANGLPDQPSVKIADVNRLFERNFSVNWARGASSTGLGLPIARSLSEQLGGRLDACCKDRELELILTLPLP